MNVGQGRLQVRNVWPPQTRWVSKLDPQNGSLLCQIQQVCCFWCFLDFNRSAMSLALIQIDFRFGLGLKCEIKQASAQVPIFAVVPRMALASPTAHLDVKRRFPRTNTSAKIHESNLDPSHRNCAVQQKGVLPIQSCLDKIICLHSPS